MWCPSMAKNTASAKERSLCARCRVDQAGDTETDLQVDGAAGQLKGGEGSKQPEGQQPAKNEFAHGGD